LFTGLVESTGRIISSSRNGEVMVLNIGDVQFAGELRKGDSVAVSGTCLTVSGMDRDSFSVEMMPETFGKTIFAETRPGYIVNLERSLALGGRFEGHIVTGHVDAVSRVLRVKKLGRTWEIDVELRSPDGKFLAKKGSVAIQGVSLTVMEKGDGFFRVGLIPETLERTSLKFLAEGTRVNVEYDIIAKYIENLLSGNGKTSERGLTREYLAEIGWE